MILVYILIGIVWSLVLSFLQRKNFNNGVDLLSIVLFFLINMILWPVSMF